MGNVVIGIEGYVGTGKTSVCRALLNRIPNSILLHGGNIYRAITYGILKTGLINVKEDNTKLSSLNMKNIMDKLQLSLKIENRESVVYIHGKKIDEEDLQSPETSIATSKISNYANNEKLYEFGKHIIEKFKAKYNIILSSRDIVNMYPKVNYHFLLVADLDERVRRKYHQYEGEISIEDLKKHIQKRDELQKESGYYKVYPITKVVDVTDCKTVEDEANKIIQYINLSEIPNIK